MCDSFSAEREKTITECLKFWRCGHWSRYLSHAKRALYHYTYIPVVKTYRIGLLLSRQLWVFFRRKSASVKNFQHAIVFLQKANNNYARCQVMEMQGIHLRALASKASHLPFWLSPRVKLSRRCFGQSAVMSFFALGLLLEWSAIVFLQKAKTFTEALEMRGIATRNSRMRSARSIIWATSTLFKIITLV